MDLNDAEDIDLALLLKKTSKMVYNMNYGDLSMFVRDGIPKTDRSGSGKSVAHLHYHILPGANVDCLAKKDDKTRIFFSKEELKQLTQTLRTERNSIN